MFSSSQLFPTRRSDFREGNFMDRSLFGSSVIDRWRLLDGGLSRRALVQSLAAGGLAAGSSGFLRLAPAVAAKEAVSSAAHRINVGEIDVLVLDDGIFEGPGNFFAVNAPPAALSDVLGPHKPEPTDTKQVAIHPLLVETGGQRVLLDTGYGALQPGAGKLLATLEAVGIAPEEIDAVLLTHMHPDHCGAVVDDRGGLVFPNARHFVNRVEYEYWWAEPSLDELTIPNEFKQFIRQVAKGVLTVLQGRIEQIAPGEEIAPGVTTVDARGHSPGHLAVEIASDGESLLHIVDAAHEPAIHLEHPDWFAAVDNWPAWTVATRNALFDRAADENLLVSTTHFPFPGVGRVTKDKIGWVWTDDRGEKPKHKTGKQGKKDNHGNQGN